jgi:hypothetical protein
MLGWLIRDYLDCKGEAHERKSAAYSASLDLKPMITNRGEANILGSGAGPSVLRLADKSGRIEKCVGRDVVASPYRRIADELHYEWYVPSCVFPPLAARRAPSLLKTARDWAFLCRSNAPGERPSPPRIVRMECQQLDRRLQCEGVCRP